MIGLLALFWLAIIILCGFWLVTGIWKVCSTPRTTSVFLLVILPLLSLIFVTWPMGGSPLVTNLECGAAGIDIPAPINASDEGLYLRKPTFFAAEIGHNLTRALVEGRLSYVEVFDGINLSEPSRGSDRYKKIYTRIIDKNSESLGSYCYGKTTYQIGDLEGKPTHICLAADDIRGPSARYELRIENPIIGPRTIAVIRDTKEDKQVARASYTNSVSRNLIPRWFPVSNCTNDKTDYRLPTRLPSMVFTSSSQKAVLANELNIFEKEPWRAVAPKNNGEQVPDGAEGLRYWQEKGHIRKIILTDTTDKDMWKNMVNIPDHYGRHPMKKARYFERIYIVEKPIRIPAGLAGADSVEFILQKDMPIPAGLLGHTIIYRVDEGCVAGCDLLY